MHLFSLYFWARAAFGLLDQPLTSHGQLWSSSFGIAGENATFDYIVIGGGTGGNTIAARLAEDPTMSVAVVEAGGFYEIDNGNRSIVPGYAPFHTGSDPDDFQPLTDWGMVTTPQAGASHRRIHYPRGKTLGGTSALNYMAYQRHVSIGTKGSYQLWADKVDDDSYTFENLLPFFQKSVTFTPPDATKRLQNVTTKYDSTVFNPSLHGPLHVSYPNWVAPLATWAQKGMAAIGMAPNDGMISGSLLGSAEFLSTVDPGNAHRSSSEASFLGGAISSTSLTVYTRAMVRKILFGANKTANGVLVTSNRKDYTLTARREIILSAGAFQSPQILMVSGIGPRETLQRYNIKVVSDLAGVGQNMWDHILWGSAYRVNVITASRQDALSRATSVEQYLGNGSGPLSNLGFYAGWEKIPAIFRSGFSNTTNAALAEFPSDWPEAEYIAVNSYMGYNKNPLTADPGDGYNYGTLAGALVAPLSRGNVTISSADVLDPPVINPNWLTHSADIEVALATFKRGRMIWDNMKNVTIGPEYLPGPKVTTDAQILDFIQESLLPVFHSACTCSMGKAGDPQAVVDSRARVFGVKGLRVVDASAFPVLPPGHPQASIYMLAEKIADDIKKGVGPK